MPKRITQLIGQRHVSEYAWVIAAGLVLHGVVAVMIFLTPPNSGANIGAGMVAIIATLAIVVGLIGWAIDAKGLKRVLIVAVLLTYIVGLRLMWLQAEERGLSQYQAIKQAREFKCKEPSLAVMTPAIHDATGAEYTFGSHCFPEGWSPKPPTTEQ